MAKYSDIENFSEKYTLLNLLGVGGFGSVLRCRSQKDQQEYAVKVLQERDDLDVEMIELEIWMCQQLEHENIVQLVEAIKETGTHYLVFPLMLGGELFDDIESRESYTELDASHCIEQVFKGVAYIHSKNIIHRDLKAKNILLTDRNTNAIVKIADFGLAVKADGKRESISGFYYHCAPERCIEDGYGRPADVWACGILFYIILTGRLPLRNMKDIAEAEDCFFLDNDMCGDICDAAKDLIRNLLKVDQDARYTAEDALGHPFIRNRSRFASRFHRSAAIENMKSFNLEKRRFRSATYNETGVNRPGPSRKSKSDDAIAKHSVKHKLPVSTCNEHTAQSSGTNTPRLFVQRPDILISSVSGEKTQNKDVTVNVATDKRYLASPNRKGKATLKEKESLSTHDLRSPSTEEMSELVSDNESSEVSILSVETSTEIVTSFVNTPE